MKMLSSKAPKKQVKNKGKKVGIKSILFLVFFMIFLAGNYLCFGKVNKVEIEGLIHLKKEEIHKKIGSDDIRGWEFLFRSVEKKAEEVIRVKEAKSKWKLPFTLKLLIEERKAKVLFLNNEEYWAVDKEGILLGPAKGEEKDLLLVKGLDNKEEFQAGDMLDHNKYGPPLKALEDFVEQWSKLPLKEINLSDLNNVKAYNYNGTPIWLGDSSNLNDKLKLLKQGLPYIEKQGYSGPIDMRYQEMIIIPPEG